MGETDKFDIMEATDCIRSWKNLFLVIVLAGMLTTQAAFWLVDLGIVGLDSQQNLALGGTEDPNSGADVSSGQGAAGAGPVPSLRITPDHLGYVVRMANGVAIVGGVLFCLTLQLGVIITAMGRLGGMQHVCRAFFLALLMLAVLLPWQHVLGPFALGLLYGPAELAGAYMDKSENPLSLALYYLRFCGLWLLGFILLLMSQLRCMRWARSILQRLEII